MPVISQQNDTKAFGIYFQKFGTHTHGVWPLLLASYHIHAFSRQKMMLEATLPRLKLSHVVRDFALRWSMNWWTQSSWPWSPSPSMLPNGTFDATMTSCPDWANNLSSHSSQKPMEKEKIAFINDKK